MQNKNFHITPVISFTTVSSFLYLFAVTAVMNGLQPGFSFQEEPAPEVITENLQSLQSDIAVPGSNFDSDPSSGFSAYLPGQSSSFVDPLCTQQLRSIESKSLTIKPIIAKQQGFYLPLLSGIGLA